MGGARLRKALRMLLPRHGAILIAMDGGAAVGVAVLTYIVALEHGGRAAWLDELYVVPERRGHGIGRSLLLDAIAIARRARCETVELEVIRGHDRAARLYLRESFRRLPRTRFSRAV
jgi:GNAT superfamily N-acetyltransferase